MFDDEWENDPIIKKIKAFTQIGRRHDFVSQWSILDVTTDMKNYHGWPTDRPLRYRDPLGDFDVVVSQCGPTWLDLWRAADNAIRASGDLHHIFIERIGFNEDCSELVLQTGS